MPQSKSFNLKEQFPELAYAVANNETIAEAYNLAKQAHIGQTRWNGDDYFQTHVCEVANRVAVEWYSLLKNPIDTEIVVIQICVALLHDVVEDTHVTLFYLSQLFSTKIVEAVDAITHKPKDESGNDTEEYDDYIERVCYNDYARRVKYHDIQHNLSSLGNDKKNVNRKRLYRLALKYISLCGAYYRINDSLFHFIYKSF